MPIPVWCCEGSMLKCMRPGKLASFPGSALNATDPAWLICFQVFLTDPAVVVNKQAHCMSISCKFPGRPGRLTAIRSHRRCVCIRKNPKQHRKAERGKLGLRLCLKRTKFEATCCVFINYEAVTVRPDGAVGDSVRVCLLGVSNTQDEVVFTHAHRPGTQDDSFGIIGITGQC